MRVLVVDEVEGPDTGAEGAPGVVEVHVRHLRETVRSLRGAGHRLVSDGG